MLDENDRYSWLPVLGSQGYDAEVFFLEDGIVNSRKIEFAGIQAYQDHAADMALLNAGKPAVLRCYGNSTGLSELGQLQPEWKRVAEEKAQKDYSGGWLIFHLGLTPEGSSVGEFMDSDIELMRSDLEAIEFKASRVFMLVSERRLIELTCQHKSISNRGCGFLECIPAQIAGNQTYSVKLKPALHVESRLHRNM